MGRSHPRHVLTGNDADILTKIVALHQVAARRGTNIGVVAAARRQLEYVYYALRDHHVRGLSNPRPTALTAAAVS